MTLNFAKSKADEQCPNKNEIITIIVMDDNNEVVDSLERRDGEWNEKETIPLNLN